MLGLIAIASVSGLALAALLLAAGVHDERWAFAAGAACGAALTWARGWLWRRRHPVIPPEEYLEAMRKNARWN